MFKMTTFTFTVPVPELDWATWQIVCLVFLYVTGLFGVRRFVWLEKKKLCELEERRGVKGEYMPRFLWSFIWLLSPIWVPFWLIGVAITIGVYGGKD